MYANVNKLYISVKSHTPVLNPCHKSYNIVNRLYTSVTNYTPVLTDCTPVSQIIHQC